MTAINKNNKCRLIRGWLSKAINRHFGPEAKWLQGHITDCPRCQRRLVSYGKVNLALSAIKAQPHKLDLLMCANAQAIGVLKHSLRKVPKARKLRQILPQPNLLERYGKYANSVANVAACIAILLLMKIGVFSSMDMFQSKGQKVIKHYYASRVGNDLADEIFSQDTELPPSADKDPFASA